MGLPFAGPVARPRPLVYQPPCMKTCLYRPWTVRPSLFFAFVLGALACLSVSCHKNEAVPTEVIRIETHANGFLNRVLFLNDTFGYAVGGERYAGHDIVSTQDGGRTWQLVEQRGGDYKALYGLGFDGQKVIAIGYEGRMYEEDERGGDWHYKPSHWWALLQDIAFPTPGEAILVTGEGYHGGKILSWDRATDVVRLIDSFAFELDAVAFPSPTVGYASGYGAALKTTDGGRTWQLMNVKGDYFKAIYCIDEHEIWMAGFNGSILHSTDGGVTWEKRRNGNSPLNPSYRFRSIVFRDARSGYISGDDGLLLKTDDGGSSWQKVKPFTKEDLRCVTLKPDGSVWLAGSGGSLFALKN